MYHDVVAGPVGLTGGGRYFAVPADAFEAQLDLLAQSGLGACSMEQALAGPGRRVAVTFDDGDAGQFERAFPALARRGMSATFFITTGWVGRPGYVSWDALREMKAAGMSIQSHTRSHPFLSELAEAELREELHASREELDARLEQRTASLALPGGDAPHASLRHLFQAEGYTALATSRWGVNPPLRADGVAWVHRCTVRGESDAAQFRRIAEGDALLAWRRRAREGALRVLRSSLGASRYARWRRRVFDALGAGEAS
jgi:peptidoglycan/xylan/chitin deacetylase (PgdA/CDA1 family)